MSWHIRQLPVQDVLEVSPRVPGGRGGLEGAAGPGHLH